MSDGGADLFGGLGGGVLCILDECPRFRFWVQKAMIMSTTTLQVEVFDLVGEGKA